MSGHSDDFEWRLAVVEEALADVGRRLAHFELDKAVESFLLARDAREAECQAPSANTQAVHESQRLCVRPTKSGRRIVDMPSAQPLSNEEIVEAIYGKLSDKVTKLNDELRLDLLFELPHLVERQLAPHRDSVSTHARGDPPQMNVVLQPSDAQFTLPSTHSVLGNTSLRTLEDLSDIDARNTDNGVAALSAPSVDNGRTSMLDCRLQARTEGLRYQLKDTIWDVLVLVGHGLIYTTDSILVLFLGVINLLIQLLFITLVQNSMPLGPIDFTGEDIVKQMVDWRVKYAHDPKFADAFINTPLAHAICTKDPLNMEGTGQAEIYRNVDDYLQETLGFKSGVMLCMLAVILWLFTCLQEVGTCSRLLRGVWCTCYDSGSSGLRGLQRLQSARSGAVVQAKAVRLDGDMPKMSVVLSMSLQRACTVTCCVLVPRICILVCLAYVGIRFISVTINLEDLILNAVALGVVLNVDEMTYDLFCPTLCKQMVYKTHPLRLPSQSLIFARTIPYLKVLGAAAMLALIRFTLLTPILRNLKLTEEAMCGGNLDFLAVQLDIGPVVAGRLVGRTTIDRTAYSYRAILQRTGLNVDESKPLGSDLWYLDSDATPALFPMQNVRIAQEYAALTIAALATASNLDSYHYRCEDMDWTVTFPSTTNAISMVIAEKTGVANHTCSYLKELGFCEANTHAGIVQRFFCPRACGLDNPTSGLAYRLPSSGAIVNVCDDVLKWDLETLPCNDLPASHPAFQVYANSMQEALRSFFVSRSEGNNTLLALNQQLAFGSLRTGGCVFAAMPPIMISFPIIRFAANTLACEPWQLRRHTVVVRSLRYLCPVSCGCNTVVKQRYRLDGKAWNREIGEIENCPRKCFA